MTPKEVALLVAPLGQPWWKLELNLNPSYCKLHINVRLRPLLQIQRAAPFPKEKTKPLDLNPNPYFKLHINVRLRPLLQIQRVAPFQQNKKQLDLNPNPSYCKLHINVRLRPLLQIQRAVPF